MPKAIAVGLAILKGEVGSFEDAVDEAEVLAIAKWLRPLYAAVDEGQVLRIPGQVFAVDLAILDDRALAMPEGVLGVEDAVA